MIENISDLTKQALKRRYLLLAEAIMKRERITQDKDFADSVGLSTQAWNNVKNSDKYFITNEVLSATQFMYQYVNPRWVLTGKGEMFEEEQELVSVEEHKKVVNENGFLKITVKTLSELLGKPKDLQEISRKNGFFMPDNIRFASQRLCSMQG